MWNFIDIVVRDLGLRMLVMLTSMMANCDPNDFNVFCVEKIKTYIPKCFHRVDKASSFFAYHCKATDICGSNQSYYSDPVLI